MEGEKWKEWKAVCEISGRLKVKEVEECLWNLQTKYHFLFFIFTIFLVFIYFFFYPLCPDVSWLIYTAKKMLNGNILYLQIIEVNPPLIILLTSIPVLIAKFTFLSSTYAFLFFVFSLIFISILLSAQVLKQIQSLSKLNFNILIYTITLILIIVPMQDFGQREHLFVIFIFPYILMMMFKNSIILSRKKIILITVFSISPYVRRVVQTYDINSYKEWDNAI